MISNRMISKPKWRGCASFIQNLFLNQTGLILQTRIVSKEIFLLDDTKDKESWRRS